MPEKQYSPVQKRNWPAAWLAWIMLALLGLGVMLTPVFIPKALAQSPTPVPAGTISDDQVNAIAKQLYCPVCESTPLDVCPTQACAEWRDLIRQMLAQGKSEADIKQYFVDRYGPRVLAAPPAQGINLLVYVVPPAAILAGIFLLYSAFRAWRRPATVSTGSTAPPAGRSTPQPNDEYIKKLEEELRKR